MNPRDNWKIDKKWSDKFLPEICAILGFYLIGEPQPEEDAERNTDLTVLRMESIRIAVRVRRYDAYLKWPDQFTIRKGRPSGTKTELTKILEGWGRYFFYGFSDEKERHLIHWTLADLNVFRLRFNQLILKTGKMPGLSQENTDGSSQFQSFFWKNFPDEFVIGSHDHFVSPFQ